jgi:hypothetical protein
MLDIVEVTGLIGATLIFTSGYIFNGLHSRLAKISVTASVFASCAMCIGFWVGFLYCAICHNELSVRTWFLYGCTISLISYIVDACLTRIER